jgi:hypothetical protein
MRARRQRNAWERPLQVGLIVLQMGPVSEDAVFELRTRVEELQDHLHDEFERYRPGSPPPFQFSVYGALEITTPPPAPYGDGFFALAQFAWDQWRYLSDVDERAGVPRSELDSRIYIVARPANEGDLQFVEGQSQQDGRVGVVEVQLQATMVDFALIVAAHELFHTLGAQDKYDEFGHVLVPDGLAEPDRTPTFPQLFVEVMARNRPLSPEVEEPPASLHELRVGPATAREIGWLR